MKRRLFHCRHDGCDSPSRHQACIRFWTIGEPGKRIELRCTSTLKVCDRHRRAAIQFLLCPSNKERIGMGLLRDGLPAPDFSSAEITFIPLVDGSPFEEMEAA